MVNGPAIAVDTQNNAYITGATNAAYSGDFPITPGAFQTSLRGDQDAFISKLNPCGSAVVYSTYLGGDFTSSSSIAVDASGNAYVTGLTFSSTDRQDFPTTPGAFETSIGTTIETFVSRLNTDGSALLYSTFLGRDGSTGYGITVDAAENAYVTGMAGLDFPTTPDSPGTSGMNFASKFSFGETGPSVSLTPASLTFPAQAVGTASATQQITLSNEGSAPLVIDSFHEANNADFNVVEGCGPYGGTLAAGSSCHIWVTFNPIQDGSRYGAAEVYDNAPGSPHIVQLKGTGTGSSPVADMEPSLPISFAPQNVGTTSAAKTLVFYNLGNAPMTITSITAGGDFVQTNNCPRTLAALATCQIPIMFRPTASGTRTGWVAISDNAPHGPQMSLLSGTGVGGPSVSLTPGSLTFAAQAVGTASLTQQITLRNVGRLLWSSTTSRRPTTPTST